MSTSHVGEEGVSGFRPRIWSVLAVRCENREQNAVPCGDTRRTPIANRHTVSHMRVTVE